MHSNSIPTNGEDTLTDEERAHVLPDIPPVPVRPPAHSAACTSLSTTRTCALFSRCRRRQCVQHQLRAAYLCQTLRSASDWAHGCCNATFCAGGDGQFAE